MLGVFGTLKQFVKVRDVSNDCPVFRIHYQFTTALLTLFILILTATQFIGNPIDCINDGEISTHIINSYCWIMSTFTMPDAFFRQVGEEVAHPGVGNVGGDWNDDEATKYYTYYQWVVFVLAFMAILCYAPKFIWDALENNIMTTVVMGLNWGLKTEDEICKKKQTLVDYMLRHLRTHDMYVYRYFFCELLCLINVIGQMYLMDAFFDGEFFTYGSRLLRFSEMPQEERVDPMVYVFPRLTKCVFHKFGPSGTVTRHDSLCVLALNIVNEKAFIFVWFWYIILATMLSCVLLMRAIMIFVPAIRPSLIHMKNRMVPKDAIEVICKKSSLGDWWLLYMLCFNLDPFVYKDVIAEMSKKIETAESNAPPSKTSMV